MALEVGGPIHERRSVSPRQLWAAVAILVFVAELFAAYHLYRRLPFMTAQHVPESEVVPQASREELILSTTATSSVPQGDATPRRNLIESTSAQPGTPAPLTPQEEKKLRESMTSQ